MIDVVVLAILIYALLGKLADQRRPAARAALPAWHPAFQTLRRPIR